MNNKLILNCFPPSNTKWASPAMSILKSFMEHHNHNTKVIYWNIILEKYIKEFYKINNDVREGEDFLHVLPFMNYLNEQFQDKHNQKKLKNHIKLHFSHMINNEDNFWVNFHSEQYKILDNTITTHLQVLNIDECILFGVPAKLHQIIPANIISAKVKQLSPKTTLLIGGIGTKEEAETILKNFPIYDYAIWGEGEYPLLMLYENITENKHKLEEIPHLAYRTNEQIILSKAQNIYLDLNSDIQPDFTDFFEQNTKSKKELSIPIERSRGCHWMKCKFCFLNDGYRYRKKKNEVIIEELKDQITKYDVKEVLFLDNDMIGQDIENFDQLMDLLIELRNTHNEFKISLGEIISKGTYSTIIKKMSLAGFRSVQIGYESPSNEILKKINKKNTFASNLLFMKWAYKYNIKIGGLNVIRGLLEETEEDIMEGIDNLRFQRFLLTNNYLHHNISSLAVGYSSRYYKELIKNQDFNQWTYNDFYEYLPKTYVNPKDRFKLFYFSTLSVNKFWMTFQQIEQHYLNNRYEYILLKCNDKIYYQEWMNKEIINEIEFDNPLHWEILKYSNKKVGSLDEIIDFLNTDKLQSTRSEIIDTLNQLKAEYLLYTNHDYSEIVSIINTDELEIN